MSNITPHSPPYPTHLAPDLILTPSHPLPNHSELSHPICDLVDLMLFHSPSTR